MAIIKLLNEETIEVKETGEQVAAILKQRSSPVSLTALDDATTIWVNIDAVAVFTDSSEGGPEIRVLD